MKYKPANNFDGYFVVEKEEEEHSPSSCCRRLLVADSPPRPLPACVQCDSPPRPLPACRGRRPSLYKYMWLHVYFTHDTGEVTVLLMLGVVLVCRGSTVGKHVRLAIRSVFRSC